MTIHFSEAPEKNCVNLKDSFGMICVHCGQCKLKPKKIKREKKKFKIGQRLQLAVDKTDIGFLPKDAYVEVRDISYYKGKYQYQVQSADRRWEDTNELKAVKMYKKTKGHK